MRWDPDDREEEEEVVVVEEVEAAGEVWECQVGCKGAITRPTRSFATVLVSVWFIV